MEECEHKRREWVDYDDTDPSVDLFECLDCGVAFRVNVEDETSEEQALAEETLALDAKALGVDINPKESNP